jgi:long-chain acyl-CoA synthetase
MRKYPKSSGRCAVGMELKIVDNQYNELPAGEIGEIMAAGTNVCLGYFKKPEATRAASKGRFMCLGDMGYLYVAHRRWRSQTVR